MKIILFSRRRVQHDAESVHQLLAALESAGFDYALNEEFAPVVEQLTGRKIDPARCYGQQLEADSDHTLMICYGGDGTLLEGVHRLAGAPIPVLGINAGHLGFLTSAKQEGLERLLGEIARGELHIERRALLEVEGGFAEQPRTCLALNEFTLQRHGAGLISVETYVDDQMVATYHGDGVIVSTPTGSTAYSLSAGGPVVAPSCACLVISPLAPHNLTMRPVVIPDESCIRLRVDARHASPFATLDNRSYDVHPMAEFKVRRARESVFLALPHNISFYDTLRNKMMWGVDMRG